jgi:hypothetical protein
MGNEFIRGVSGGEKKRVTVGVDLMKGSDVILMDGIPFISSLFAIHSTFFTPFFLLPLLFLTCMQSPRQDSIVLQQLKSWRAYVR